MININFGVANRISLFMTTFSVVVFALMHRSFLRSLMRWVNSLWRSSAQLVVTRIQENALAVGRKGVDAKAPGGRFPAEIREYSLCQTQR